MSLWLPRLRSILVAFGSCESTASASPPLRSPLRQGLAIALLLVACGSDGIRLSVDLRTDYAPGIEFERVEVDIGGRAETALASDAEDYLRGVRVADLSLSKGLQEGTVRLYTPLGVLLAERGVSIMMDSRFGTTITVDRSCEDVACPMGGDARAVSCLGGRCVDPLCVTGEEETCPEPQCAADSECPSEGCGEGRCRAGTCLLEGGVCDDGFYCAGSECRVRPMFGDAGTGDAGSGIDAGSELCGVPCELPGSPCARAEFTCVDDLPVCEAVGPQDASVVCRAAAGDCDVEERCDGSNLDCPVDRLRTGVCRPSLGDCDPEEVCDESSRVCPPDQLSEGDVCRGAVGACDAAEICTGDSAECPLDTFVPFGTACTDGSCNGLGECTSCVEGDPCSTGNVCERGIQSCVDMACVAAGPAADDTVCRAASGPCDRVETCGGATTCPGDAFEPAGDECRPSVGACDIAESCTGFQADCPPDLMIPDGDSCGTASGCAPESLCMAGACMTVDEPSCSTSLEFDAADDLASLVTGLSEQMTFEIFLSLEDAGGAVLSLAGAWTLNVRPTGAAAHEVTLSTGSDDCSEMSLGAFDSLAEWVHIALWVDIDSGRATAFAEGTMLGSVPVATSVAEGTLVLGVDQACFVPAEPYGGKLANLRIWNRLVPEAELRENATGNDPPVTAGLAHWYRMDENTGQRLNDEIAGFFGFRGRDATPEPTDPRWVPGSPEE